jgi:putative DNA primase/helicase
MTNAELDQQILDIDQHSDISRLAALSAFDYAKCRVAAAEMLGITVGGLDKAVNEHKIEEPPKEPDRWKLDPWDKPVDGVELLDDLREIFERYLILPEHGSVTMALWVMHAHAIDAAYVSPFLMFSSPEMRCGKSTAMALLSRTAPRTAMASNISPAAIFRYIEAFRPTLLIDEADSFAVENEELRGILNSGHTRDTASVIRLTGDDHEPKDFSTWAPKAIASIGKLANTLRDRSIILPMKRKRAGERVVKLRAREDIGEFLILRRKAKRWVADNIKALTESLPEIPESLNDRAADNWEPLLAIADLAGGDWPAAARKAATGLSGADAVEPHSIRIELLAAIKRVFAKLNVDRISSKALIAELVNDEDGPWAAYGKSGKPIVPRQVAHLLSDFEIHPRNVRGAAGPQTASGYDRDWFTDVFLRYLPDPSDLSRTPAQVNNVNDLDENLSRTHGSDVRNKYQPNLLNNKGCAGVRDKNPHERNEGPKCAQCGAHDGTERAHTIGGTEVWLHPECAAFWPEGDGWGLRRT